MKILKIESKKITYTTNKIVSSQSQLPLKAFNDKQHEKKGHRSSHSTLWSSAPSELDLTRDEVHVWCVNFNVFERDIHALRLNLSKDENAKAESFYFYKDKKNYIGRHAILRRILGRYLSIAPNNINFSYSSHGKPSLCNYSNGDTIHFNLSHSKGLVLYAITRGREVGIDVERIIPGIMDTQFSSYVFSQKELYGIQSLPSDLRMIALFQYWTRKEAFVKALGKGLSYDLKKIDVSGAFGENNIISHRNSDAHDGCRWSLRDIEVGSGYAASIVVKGYNWRLKCWKMECDCNYSP
jgi:4'-phosphopantetheinyl transferase